MIHPETCDCDACVDASVDCLMEEIEGQSEIMDSYGVTADLVQILPGLDISTNERCLNLIFTSPTDETERVIFSLNYDAAAKLLVEGMECTELLWNPESGVWPNEQG